jgi:hypothetical protein
LDKSKSYYNVVRNRFFAPENRIETIFLYTTILCYTVSFFFFSCPLSKVDSYIIDDGCNPMIRWVYNARPQRMLTRCVLLLSPFYPFVCRVSHTQSHKRLSTHTRVLGSNNNRPAAAARRKKGIIDT